MGTDSRFKSTNHWSPPWHTLSRSTPFNLVGELPVWTHPHNPFRPRWCSTTNWMGELDFNIITDLLRSVWWKHNLSPPSAYAERSIFSHVQGGMKSSRARSRLDFAVFYGTNALNMRENASSSNMLKNIYSQFCYCGYNRQLMHTLKT